MIDSSRGVLAMLLDSVWIENLVRFPVERRAPPTYEMMCDLAPDSRMIPAVAEAMRVDDIDLDLRHAVDREMAEYLATAAVPASGTERQQFFVALRAQVLAPAITASVEAKRVADDAYRASRVAIEAQQKKELNSFSLGRRANHFLNTSARAGLEAHRLCEIARGKCRALTLAEMGEPWVPFDAQEASAWLVHASDKTPAGRAVVGKG
jgi:hypothetical protein